MPILPIRNTGLPKYILGYVLGRLFLLHRPFVAEILLKQGTLNIQDNFSPFWFSYMFNYGCFTFNFLAGIPLS